MKLQFWPKSSHLLSTCLLSATLINSGIAQTPSSAPEENRFTKNVLLEKLDEPTELVVLEDQRVLFTAVSYTHLDVYKRQTFFSA